MTLLYITNNAIIRVGALKNLENEKKLYISSKDFEEKSEEKEFLCNNYIDEIKNGYLAELDYLLIKEENKTVYIDSYEIKASKRNNFFRPRIMNQLFKQALFLSFLVIDGLLIKQKDICIVNSLESDNYIIRVKYLNGIKENDLKNFDFKEKINYMNKNSYLVYNVRIENKFDSYLLDFYGVFTDRIYNEKIEIYKRDVKKYIEVLSKDYKRIVKKFLTKNIKNNKKREKSLEDIIKDSISQNFFQDQE
ncbi:MAG: hypothetical protein QXI77_01720 [Nanopusillaceae archaeon]